MESANAAVDRRVPWNKGKLTGQKPRNLGNSNETSDGFEHSGTRDVQSRN